MKYYEVSVICCFVHHLQLGHSGTIVKSETCCCLSQQLSTENVFIASLKVRLILCIFLTSEAFGEGGGVGLEELHRHKYP